MTRQEIIIECRTICNLLPYIDGKEIDELLTTDLFELGADSLDTIEITMAVEERFGIQVYNDEEKNVVTFGDLVHLIEHKIPSQENRV